MSDDQNPEEYEEPIAPENDLSGVTITPLTEGVAPIEAEYLEKKLPPALLSKYFIIDSDELTKLRVLAMYNNLSLSTILRQLSDMFMLIQENNLDFGIMFNAYTFVQGLLCEPSLRERFEVNGKDRTMLSAFLELFGKLDTLYAQIDAMETHLAALHEKDKQFTAHFTKMATRSQEMLFQKQQIENEMVELKKVAGAVNQSLNIVDVKDGEPTKLP